MMRSFSMSEGAQENDFHAYMGIFKRRSWAILSVLVIVVTLVSISSFKAPRVYRATAQILIEKETTVNPYREGVAIDISGMDYYQTQYRIMKSRSLAKKVYADLRLGRHLEFAAKKSDPIDGFLKHIIVEPIRGSRLVNLNAESQSPELAMRIANSMADAYIKQNLENKLYASREILKKLPSNMSLSNISQRDREALPSVVTNPLIQALKEDLIKYEAEYANLSQRYKSKHPTLLTLQAKIESLRSQIEKETFNTVESIKTELSGEFKANNVRIVDFAEEPESPVRPKRKRNIILGFLFGLMGGLGLALILEYIDDTVKNATDIEKFLALPFLGIIPIVKNRDGERFIMDDPHSPAIEAVKGIRTNLVFSAAEDKLKTILFTSCSPGEGKTFVSMNVAASFALAGKKTLLIDTDLRRATLTKSIGLNADNGVSNYLIGETDFSGIIQQTDVKNLSFMAAGAHSPDPAELLGSEKMKELIAEAKKNFDRVIVDSAPVLPVSDTLNISPLMDGIVQVVYCEKLSRNLVTLGKQKLQGVGAKIVGVILNHVNVRSHGYHGYGYYSYGEYGDYY